jgi:hypothetical protein
MLILLLFLLLVYWVGVPGGIYKGSYKISYVSYLDSPPPLLSFIPPPPFWEQFQQVSVSHLLTQHCTPLATPPALFAVVILEIGSHF